MALGRLGHKEKWCLFLGLPWNQNMPQAGDQMDSESSEVELVRVPGGMNARSIIAALQGRGIPARSHGEIVGEIYSLTLDGSYQATLDFRPRVNWT